MGRSQKSGSVLLVVAVRDDGGGLGRSGRHHDAVQAIEPTERAERRTADARARIALTQGLFLGALGIGVLAFAAWRAFNAVAPEAELMGGIGIVALIVNISAALVLSRFRDGDANVRAVWLFSRNDALANVAVIFAAALVGWTGQAWPDLAVAGVIALLFLHSAFEIIRHARVDMRETA